MSTPIRVLVLEDSAVDAELNIRELRRAGFDPQWKRVETEADFLAALDPSPDLTLADYSLPNFDGLGAVKILRERGLDIPFILVSGVIGEEKAVEAMKQGVSDYVPKDRIPRLGMSVERALDAKRLRDELLKAQRMEAFGLLAGGVAHYFNNMMGVVIGYSDICLSKLPFDSPIFKNILQIKSAGQQAASMTAKLLALSRKTILMPYDLDLNSIIGETKKVLSLWLGATTELSVILTPGIPRIRADPDQIKQALTNLAVNALDAMPTGGTLTLETRTADLDEAYVRQHPGAKAGRNVMLSVRDSGTGMPPDVLTRIFEPFFTTKDIGSATGLGLAVVHGIVTQNGGSIDVISRVGVGTTFNLYFPITSEIVAPVENSN